MLLPLLRHFPQRRWRWLPKLYQNHTASLFTTPATLSENSEQRNLQETNYELSLTKDEAISYLEDVLNIPDPVNLLNKSRKNFLQEVLRSTKMTQPYTNITYVDNGRHVTVSPAHTKQSMLTRLGGGCLQFSHFTQTVLNHMGIEAYPIAGALSKNRTRKFRAHTSLILKGFEHQESMHMLEAGTIYPILNPISLDFMRVSPVIQLANCPVRLFKESPGIVKLCLPATEDQRNDADVYREGGAVWRTAITFFIEQPVSWEFAYEMSISITENRHLIPVIHQDILVFGFSGGLWTVIWGKGFAQFKDGREEARRQLSSYREVIENTHDHFPQYSKQLLEAAVNMVYGSAN